MPYCILHEDMGDEKDCPLCECMRNKAATITRIGKQYQELQDELTALKARLAEAEVLLATDKHIFAEMDRVHPNLKCYCNICQNSRGIEPCDEVVKQIKKIEAFLSSTTSEEKP
jgi:hypothetical protein